MRDRSSFKNESLLMNDGADIEHYHRWLLKDLKNLIEDNSVIMA